MIERLNVLSEFECSEIRARLFELRDRWISRNQHLPIFTLAAASYMDAAPPGSPAAYYRSASRHNGILKDSFGELYERLFSALSEHLHAPVTHCERFALPGFHIFFAHPYFEKPVAPIHCDLQYQLLGWENPHSIDISRPLSFTLAIALPRAGAGLKIWDLDQNELEGLSSWQQKSLYDTRKKTYVPYEVGSMILHSGHTAHQIAPMTETIAGEERITLQGHAILGEGTWQLYW